MSEEFAYVAALIDGEGCIDLDAKTSGREGSYYARVKIGMTEPALPVLKWLHQEWGGSLVNSHRTPEKRRSIWTWSVSGANAATVIRQVSPYLRVKLAQARLVLEVERIRADLPRRGTSGTRAEWNSRARAECEAIKTKLHRLNARGPSAAPTAEDSYLPSPPISTWNPEAQLWETDQMDLFYGRQEPYSVTFPTSGMTRAGRLFRLPQSEPLIDEKGSSSSDTLPTPRAEERMQHNSRDNGVALSRAVLPTPQSHSVRSSRRAMVENQQWTHPGLEQAVEIAQGILPREFQSWDEVPGSSRPVAEENTLLPTPITGDAKAARNRTSGRQPGSKHHDGETLTDAVIMLPSPRATDGTKGGPNQHGSSGDLMLPSAVLRLEE